VPQIKPPICTSYRWEDEKATASSRKPVSGMMIDAPCVHVYISIFFTVVLPARSRVRLCLEADKAVAGKTNDADGFTHVCTFFYHFFPPLPTWYETNIQLIVL
jgi:hypothetical protein